MKWVLSICAVLIVAALCVWAVIHSTMRETREMARSAAEAVASILKMQPQVTVKHSVWVQQSRDVLQLVTQEQALAEETEFTHTYLGSTKRLRGRAQFTVKAGYDLRREFQVTLSGDGKTARADFPEPEILSVEMGRFEALQDESGWWNYLTAGDREEALGTLQTQARREAVASGLLEKARTSLAEQLKALGKTRGQEWTVQFRTLTVAPAVVQPTLRP